MVLFGQASQRCEQLSEHDLTDHHLTEEVVAAGGIVEIGQLEAGYVVGRLSVGGEDVEATLVGAGGDDHLAGRVAYQVAHLDLDFYAEHYHDDTLTPAHVGHATKWHSSDRFDRLGV